MLKSLKQRPQVNLFIWVALFLFVITVGCERDSNPSESKPTVVATTGIIADGLTQLLLDDVKVISLMGPGVDPHLYKVSHGDIVKLQAAQVVFYNGLHLEGKMAEVLAGYSKQKTCVPVAEAIDDSKRRKSDEANGIADPHVWFDVQLWRSAVIAMKQALVKEFPELAVSIESRHVAYDSQLINLDRWVRQELASIPQERRVLITAHDAFGYFGEAYGIEVHGLQGVSTAAEFGLYDLKQLVELISTRKIPAIFTESSVSPKFITALRDGVAARGHQIKIGGELFSDALGAKGSLAESYVGMVQQNVNTIKSALQ